MASVNPLTKEILIKVVYYGPGLGGKTTTLQHIHKTVQPDHRGKMVSLATPVDRTLYFDFLPVRLPKIGDYTLRLQLFTVPGQVHYNATRKLVLTGADGVVLVADSQVSRMDANIESLENLVDNLHEQKIAFGELPFLLQYNKRDLLSLSSLEELEKNLNHRKSPSVETCATTGLGVFQGLEIITKEILRDLKRKDIFSASEHTSTDKMERQISFKKDQQGIMTSIREFSETSSREISGFEGTSEGNDELTAAYPIMEMDAVTITGECERDDPYKKETTPPPRQVTKAQIPQNRLGKSSQSQEPNSAIENAYVQAEMRRADSIHLEMKTEPPDKLESLSFSPLWNGGNEEIPKSIELLITSGKLSEAIVQIWDELRRLISITGEGVEDNSPKNIIGLLGIDGREYLEVSRIATLAQRELRKPSLESALKAYLTLIKVATLVETDY